MKQSFEMDDLSDSLLDIIISYLGLTHMIHLTRTNKRFYFRIQVHATFLHYLHFLSNPSEDQTQITTCVHVVRDWWNKGDFYAIRVLAASRIGFAQTVAATLAWLKDRYLLTWIMSFYHTSFPHEIKKIAIMVYFIACKLEDVILMDFAVKHYHVDPFSGLELSICEQKEISVFYILQFLTMKTLDLPSVHKILIDSFCAALKTLNMKMITAIINHNPTPRMILAKNLDPWILNYVPRERKDIILHLLTTRVIDDYMAQRWALNYKFESMLSYLSNRVPIDWNYFVDELTEISDEYTLDTLLYYLDKGARPDKVYTKLFSSYHKDLFDCANDWKECMLECMVEKKKRLTWQQVAYFSHIWHFPSVLAHAWKKLQMLPLNSNESHVLEQIKHTQHFSRNPFENQLSALVAFASYASKMSTM